MRALLAVVAVLVLCPPATGLAADAHRVSLASGELDGRQVLGRSMAEVTAMLGKPDFRSGSLRRPRIGWGRPDNRESRFPTRSSLIVPRSKTRPDRSAILVQLHELPAGRGSKSHRTGSRPLTIANVRS
jgi:hypothetical protein